MQTLLSNATLVRERTAPQGLPLVERRRRQFGMLVVLAAALLLIAFYALA